LPRPPPSGGDCTGPAAGPTPVRFLVIVRRGHASLYDRLSNQFPLDVIWDRRQADRRRQARPIGRYQWRSDRRQPVRETWTTFGFVVATVRR